MPNWLLLASGAVSADSGHSEWTSISDALQNLWVALARTATRCSPSYAITSHFAFPRLLRRWLRTWRLTSHSTRPPGSGHLFPTAPGRRRVNSGVRPMSEFPFYARCWLFCLVVICVLLVAMGTYLSPGTLGTNLRFGGIASLGVFFLSQFCFAIQFGVTPSMTILGLRATHRNTRPLFFWFCELIILSIGLLLSSPFLYWSNIFFQQ